MKFDGKLLIFFDTETTGLEPNNSYEQLTQIAAAVVDGSTWNVVERINEYVSLTDATIRVLNDPTSPEASAYPTAILVAHSAVFDMKVVAARRRANGLPRLNRRSVVDIKDRPVFLVPVLQVMESSDWAGEMLTALRAKTKYKSYSGQLLNIFNFGNQIHFTKYFRPFFTFFTCTNVN